MPYATVMGHFTRISFTFACLAGGSAVLIAAAAAHMPGLADASRAIIERASFYQLIHALMLALLTLTYRASWRVPMVAFMLGILCFCGGIYLHHLMQVTVVTRIVPVGGIAFASGWFLMLFGLRKGSA